MQLFKFASKKLLPNAKGSLSPLAKTFSYTSLYNTVPYAAFSTSQTVDPNQTSSSASSKDTGLKVIIQYLIPFLTES